MAVKVASIQIVCDKCKTPYAVAAVKTGAPSRCPACGTMSSSKNLTPARRTGEARRTPAAGSRSTPSWHEQETLAVSTRTAGKPGTPAPAPPPPEPRPAAPSFTTPSKLGPYEILEEIGRGGMGLVLRGRDASLRREVAIKILRPEAQGDDGRRLRFTEEAQVTGQLEHPGIVPVHFLGQDAEGRAFFSMKLVTGLPLDQIVRNWHAGDAETLEEYPLTRLLSIFERVCETVGFAHSKGILHRDLKPSNVMIGSHGEVWVLDWGLAKAIKEKDGSGTIKSRATEVKSVRQDLGKDLTLDGLTVGTPEYMSPEQAAGDPLDEGADIFGLGGVLYALLTGHAPIRGKSVEDTVSNAAHGKFTPLRRTGAGKQLPAALVAITEKCLEKSRKERYRNAKHLLRDLRAFAAGEAVSALPDTSLDRLRRFARRHRTGVAITGAAAGLLLLTLTIAAIIVAGKEREARNAQDEAQADRLRAQASDSKRLQAESEKLQAELQKQKVLAASSEKAQRRLRAFEPYARSMDLLMRGQLPERAAEDLKRALAIDPDFPEAQFALAESLRFSGSPHEAALAYLKADELSRKLANRPNLQAIVYAGFAFDGAGFYKEAEDAFERAENNGANDPLAIVGKIFRLAHNRNLKEAQRLADDALLAAPHLWETHFAVGYIAREMSEDGVLPPSTLREISIPEFRKAVDLAPRQAEAVSWLALTLGRYPEDQAEARKLIERTVELEPNNGNRFLHRASARLSAGDAAGAEQDLAAARRLKASPMLLKEWEAQRAAQAGDRATAYKLIGEVVADAYEWPPLIANYLNLGNSLGHAAENAELYERWRKANPTYPQVRAYTAYMSMVAKDFAGAQKELEAGLKDAPYNITLLHLKAELLVLGRKHAEALATADEALKFYPKDPGLSVERLRALAGLARFDEALEFLTQLEKDAPAQKAQWAGYRELILKAKAATK
ncbi:MAG: protein kinase [Planctomycetes bacterium]|nr:protein kinase [Planctomycetota bacterium]